MLERALRPGLGDFRSRKKSAPCPKPMREGVAAAFRFALACSRAGLPCAFKRFASIWRWLAMTCASERGSRPSLNGPKRHEAGANLGLGPAAIMPNLDREELLFFASLSRLIETEITYLRRQAAALLDP